MEQKPPHSPWFRDVRWGEWAFFIFFSGVIGWAGALFVPGSTRDSAITAGVAAGVAAATAFIRNPKSLPWIETKEEE